jgi:hypothetical protein
MNRENIPSPFSKTQDLKFHSRKRKSAVGKQTKEKAAPESK